MALPTAFSNNTSPTGPQLDGNFAAVGALTVIPCTVAGTNTLVLTPNANTPTTNAYANYGRFSGVAAATNTGAVTARIGGLGALPVYRDTPSGPAALVGGEIVIACAFVLIYDSALNSSNGGWHLISQANSFPYTGGTIVNGTLSSLVLTGAGVTAPTLTGSVGSLASLQIGATAATITRMVSGLATLSYSLIAANASQSQQMTVTGAQVNDAVLLGPPAALTTGLGLTGFVPAADTVSVRVLNVTAGTIGAFSLVMRAVAMGATP